MEINQQIDAFVLHADNVTATYWKNSGFTYTPPPTHTAEYISDKWCRITTMGPEGRSVYAFVALKDFETKALGQIKAGDIHKAATFKAPAKHARGNVFLPPYTCATPYGIVYLK